MDYTSRAGTAVEILREVLGVPTTIPIWDENDLKRFVDKYQAVGLTKENLDELKADLNSAGLGDLFPEALVGLSRGR